MDQAGVRIADFVQGYRADQSASGSTDREGAENIDDEVLESARFSKKEDVIEISMPAMLDCARKPNNLGLDVHSISPRDSISRTPRF